MRKGTLSIDDGKRLYTLTDVTKVIFYDITRTVKLYQKWDYSESQTVFQIEQGTKIKAKGISIKVRWFKWHIKNWLKEYLM